MKNENVQAIPMEDWLRSCVYHDGKHGEVTLPCDRVLEIADYIQMTRTSLTEGLIGLRGDTDDMAIEALKGKAIARDEATQELAEWRKQMKDHGVPPYSAKYKALNMAIRALKEKPVKHGEWVESKIPNELYVCSNCGGACWSYDYERTIVKSNFCPNCGAKMDKEKE